MKVYLNSTISPYYKYGEMNRNQTADAKGDPKDPFEMLLQKLKEHLNWDDRVFGLYRQDLTFTIKSGLSSSTHNKAQELKKIFKTMYMTGRYCSAFVV